MNAQHAITASHELPHYNDLYGSKKLTLELEVILWCKLYPNPPVIYFPMSAFSQRNGSLVQKAILLEAELSSNFLKKLRI